MIFAFFLTLIIGLFYSCFHMVYTSMKGVLLVYMMALCLLLTPDSSMMVRAGTVTKIKKLKTWFDKYEWYKGCPMSLEIRNSIHCELVFRGKSLKIDCRCEKWNPFELE